MSATQLKTKKNKERKKSFSGAFRIKFIDSKGVVEAAAQSNRVEKMGGREKEWEKTTPVYLL